MIRFKKVPNDIFKKAMSETCVWPDLLSEDGYTDKLLDELEMPKRATAGSAGYDIRTPFAFRLNPGKSVLVPTGISCEMPMGVMLALFPRSGLGFKFHIGLANTVGIVDSDFINSDTKGHIMVKLCNNGEKAVHFNANDKICQGILLPFCVTDDDDADGVRKGGFGSTDKK